MIRLLLFLLLFFLGYTLFSALLRGLPGRRQGPPPEKTAGGEDMVHDPQCGVYLPRGDAVTARKGSETLHFCSEDCRRAFFREP